jgi:hypothetical protein
LAAGNALRAVGLSITAEVEGATDGVERLKVDRRSGTGRDHAERGIGALVLSSMLAGQGSNERGKRKKGGNLHFVKSEVLVSKAREVLPILRGDKLL